MSEQDDRSVPDVGDPRRSGGRLLLLVLTLAAAGAVLLTALVMGVTVRPAPVAAGPRPDTTTSAGPSSAPSTASAPTAPTPTMDADPAALADLDAVAATLPTPLVLTSPPAWDQWLPEGKPYPGSSLEEEISTCPRLATRLSAALGQKMSYWTGTLPLGPYGCTWVPVPLVYDSPDYDYVISVGFLADGTTAASLARSNATADGPCPWNEVPAVAPGAVLIRCAPGTSTEYTLALPDTRLPGGLWTLIVNVKDRAAVPAAQVLPVLVEGAVDAFG
jgi:hypothetical protein